ncbi:hypothetical protein [Microtetraspora glauca]|uniref:Uncharacterized protein n=1 Tax=Microtetraspora glauca TaxID=1996 RepID=A0ABV3GSN8_MICGL
MVVGQEVLRLDKTTAKVEATRYYIHDTVAVAVRTTTAVRAAPASGCRAVR